MLLTHLKSHYYRRSRGVIKNEQNDEEAENHDLIGATQRRHARAQWSDKGRIINELVNVCGYGRKHLIRLLNETVPVAPKAAKQRRVKYDDEVKRALRTVCMRPIGSVRNPSCRSYRSWCVTSKPTVICS